MAGAWFRGFVKHDRELWDIMVEAINKTGYEGKVGIQVDVAAGTYYDKDKERYVGHLLRRGQDA